MVRLPVPGQDDGVWGNVLNEFLLLEHDSSGNLKNVARPADVSAKYTKPSGGIPEADLDSGVQTKLNSGSSSGVTVKKGGTTIGTESNLNLIQGSGITITATDNSGTSAVDVTLAASGAGTIGLNTKTVDFSVADADAGCRYLANSSGAITVTVPSGLTVGEAWEVERVGSGAVVIQAGAGVTLHSAYEYRNIARQYSIVSLVVVGTDEIHIHGDLA